MGKNMIFKREGGGGDNFSGKYLPQIVNTIVEVLLVIPWYTKLDNPIFHVNKSEKNYIFNTFCLIL